MPDNNQLTTTTNDIMDEEVREKRRQRTAEIPVELKEFASNYDVDGLVGEGGMSAVYRAKHKSLNKPMAIKMLHAHLLRDAVQLKRFEQEAQALFMLQHENIVTVREFGSTSTGKPYLVMDFLEGKSLSEILKSEGPLPVDRALKIFLQVCGALAHAHSKSIIHRDIKPSNIVICQDARGEDSVRIVDFGIAKFACEDINPGLTQTGDVFGSPLYMSPEQCLGNKLDQRTDMYALGCVMYEALSGRPPLVGETALSTIHKHTTEMPEPLVVPNCDPKLRARLDEIVFKTLEKQPEKRYQSMNALQAELKELAADTDYRGKTGHYVRYARLNRKALNTAKKHPYRAASIFAALIAIIALSTSNFWEHSRTYLEVPQTLNEKLDWNWNTKPIKIADVDFNDKARQAWLLIDDLSMRLGRTHERVKLFEFKMAQLLMERGRWEEASTYLKALQQALSLYDPRLADTNLSMGDVYVQRKEWAEAAKCYQAASVLYEKNFTGADNSKDLAKLKYAWSLLRTHQIGKAQSYFKVVLEQNNDASLFEYDFSAAGLGDCDLAQLEAGASNAADLRDDAVKRYEIAAQHFPKYSKHDGELCKLRTADLFILDGKWAQARAIYDAVVPNLSLFSNAEAAAIQRNYARLLMRTFNIPGAFKADKEALEAERRAAKELNEQNTVRFDGSHHR